jgi:hypothetical protein
MAYVPRVLKIYRMLADQPRATQPPLLAGRNPE